VMYAGHVAALAGRSASPPSRQQPFQGLVTWLPEFVALFVDHELYLHRLRAGAMRGAGRSARGRPKA
jgi:hypothetical protein